MVMGHAMNMAWSMMMLLPLPLPLSLSSALCTLAPRSDGDGRFNLKALDT